MERGRRRQLEVVSSEEMLLIHCTKIKGLLLINCVIGDNVRKMTLMFELAAAFKECSNAVASSSSSSSSFDYIV